MPNVLFSYVPGQGGYTFTRSAGGATYHDVDGVVQNAGANVLRDAHYIDGVRHTLVEQARTNSSIWSQDATNAFYTKTGITITTGLADPYGGTIGDKLVEDTGTTEHILSHAYTLATALPCAYSVYAKPSGRDWVVVKTINQDGVTRRSYINIADRTQPGTVDAGHVVRVVWGLTGGFVRVEVSINAQAGANNLTIAVGPTTGDGVSSYTGDGASGVVWAAEQVELGNYAPSSYVATIGATATRNSDQLSYPFPYAPTVMTQFIDMTELGNVRDASGLNPRLIDIANGSSATPRFIMYADATKYTALHNNGAASVTRVAVAAPVPGDRVQVAVRLAATGTITLEQAINDVTAVTAASGTNALAGAWSVPTSIWIGTSGTVAGGIVALRKVLVVDAVLTINELLALPLTPPVPSFRAQQATPGYAPTLRQF